MTWAESVFHRPELNYAVNPRQKADIEEIFVNDESVSIALFRPGSGEGLLGAASGHAARIGFEAI